MKCHTILSATLLLLGAILLQAEPENIFTGTPRFRVVAHGKAAESVVLSAKETEEYVCRIAVEDGRFLWTSRENKELLRSESGAFTLYMARDGSGMIKIVNDQTVALQDYDYFEQLSLGMTTYTYWGERSSTSRAAALQKMVQESKLAQQSPAISSLLATVKLEMLAVEKACGALVSGYEELDLTPAQDGSPTKTTMQQIQGLRDSSDSLVGALLKYEQRINSASPSFNLKFNEEQAQRLKTGFKSMRVLATLGKRVAESASLYVVSLSEADRLKFVKDGTDFEVELAAIQNAAQSKLKKLDSILDGKK